jgi:hypothetical protein
MTVELVPFHPSHLDMFVPGKWDGAINTWEFREYALKNQGKGLTAVINDRIMGFVWVTQPVDGVSTVEMYACDELREKHWLWMALSFKRALERYDVPKNLGIERLRVRVFLDFKESAKWLQRLGFMPLDIEPSGMVLYERAV